MVVGWWSGLIEAAPKNPSGEKEEENGFWGTLHAFYVAFDELGFFSLTIWVALFVLFLFFFLCRLILVRKKESAKGRNRGSRIGVKQRNRAKLLLLLLNGSKEMASVWKHEGVKQLTVTALLKGYLQLQVLASISYISLKKNRNLIQFSNGCFQARREKISVRMKLLQSLVPGCDQVLINYFKLLVHVSDFFSEKITVYQLILILI